VKLFVSEQSGRSKKKRVRSGLAFLIALIRALVCTGRLWVSAQTVTVGAAFFDSLLARELNCGIPKALF